MTKTKAFIIGSLVLVGAAGCSSRDPRGTTMTRDPQVQRSENARLTRQNWREVQNFLAQQGYNPGQEDGATSDQTRQAILSFQQHNKIETTGILNAQTLRFMQEDGAKFSGSLAVELNREERDQYID